MKRESFWRKLLGMSRGERQALIEVRARWGVLADDSGLAMLEASSENPLPTEERAAIWDEPSYLPVVADTFGQVVGYLYFLVNGETVGEGPLSIHAEITVELKRMLVYPNWRGYHIEALLVNSMEKFVSAACSRKAITGQITYLAIIPERSISLLQFLGSLGYTPDRDSPVLSEYFEDCDGIQLLKQYAWDVSRV